jgi:hypothetical protein
MKLSEDNVFKNKAFAYELQELGVVKIPFLSDTELSELNQFYNNEHPTGQPPTMYDGIHMTTWHKNLDYKLHIKSQLKKIIDPACERVFVNYRAISQQFIVKLQGNETTFPIHQDWAIVDENKYFSLNLWIPLQDVDEKNGSMYIVRGSHKINKKIRGAGILFPNYHQYLDFLKPQMIQFDVKAGEALIFYHSTIHGSPYNQCENARKVVQVSVLPKEAPIQIYFQSEKDSPLEIHHPEDDFNFYYNDIREESETRPPTDKPSELVYGFQYKQIETSDLQ